MVNENENVHSTHTLWPSMTLVHWVAKDGLKTGLSRTLYVIICRDLSTITQGLTNRFQMWLSAGQP